MKYQVKDLINEFGKAYLPCCGVELSPRTSHGTVQCSCPTRTTSLRLLIENCPHRDQAVIRFVDRSRCHQKDRRVFWCRQFEDECTIAQTGERSLRVCLRCEIPRKNDV